MEPTKKTAISVLAPGCAYSIEDPSGTANIVNWRDNGTGNSQPTDEAIQTELDKQNLEWTANEYARNRKAEYPDWGTQLNKIYDDGVTKWKSEMVDPVKAKWPKDNSGPV